MKQFKSRLTNLLRKELCLSSEAEAKILSIFHAQQSPGKIFRFLVNLYHFKILWVFPRTEQRKIIESICGDLSHNSYTKRYFHLINIIFVSSLNEKNETTGIENFISFTKTNMKNESDFTIKAGLSLVLLRIVNNYPGLAHRTGMKELVPSLLFLKDNISYASILNHLFHLFGAHQIVPLLIDLLIKHPLVGDIILTRTLFEHAIMLTQNQKRTLFERLQVFLQTQKEILGEEKISRLHARFVIELGRLNYLKIAPAASMVSVNKASQTCNVKQGLNKRLSLLHQMKGG